MSNSVVDLPKMPKVTLERLVALSQQRKIIENQMQLITLTFLEAHGLDGVYDVDMATGELHKVEA